MYAGFQCDHTTTCHAPRKIAMASSFGQTAAQVAFQRFGADGTASPSASMPASSRSSLPSAPAVASIPLVPAADCLVSIVCMTADLCAKAVGDGRRGVGDLGGVDAARAVDVDVELGDDPAGAA